MDNLKKLLAPKYIDAISSVDEEKKIISFNNDSVHIALQENRNLICVFAYVQPKKALEKKECVDIANSWNQKKIFMLLCYDEDVFRAEYYLSYAGGINVDNLNASLDYYFSLLSGFAKSLNEYCSD